jgi:hypothetical protein
MESSLQNTAGFKKPGRWTTPKNPITLKIHRHKLSDLINSLINASQTAANIFDAK